MNSYTLVRRFIMITLGFLAIVGTFWITSRSDDLVDHEIRGEELYGIWTLNRSTLEDVQGVAALKIDDAEHAVNTIELRNDGTCSYSTYNVFHPFGRYLKSEGTWSVKKDRQELVGETWYIEFDLRPSSYELVGTRFYLKRKDGRLVLYDFIDDPDLYQFVEFERQ